jgi:hypothetical protein
VRDIRIPAWSSQERRAPAADADSLARIMLAVLARAGGSLPPATVTAVFAHRFPNALDPSEEPLAGTRAVPPEHVPIIGLPVSRWSCSFG